MDDPNFVFEALKIIVGFVVLILTACLGGRLLLRFNKIFIPQKIRNPLKGATKEVNAYLEEGRGEVLCPKCGQPMQQGYTASRLDPARWVDVSELVGASIRSYHEEKNTGCLVHEYLANGSWRCEKCSMVLIDHSSLVDYRTWKR